jgi:D-alanyl-D-alanine dipeptidase
LLGTAFGYESELPEGSKRYPYFPLHTGVACIEDKNSKHYNQLIDPAVTSGEWAGRSEMLRPDGLFRWGLVILHNTMDTVPGAGSCIFLHIWRGRGKGTAGCTATSPKDVEETLGWLDPESRPVLVQLPEPEYARLRAGWALP